MKHFKFTSYLTIAILIIASVACKKLTEIELDFTTGLLKVKMTSDTIGVSRVNMLIPISVFSDNISISDTIDKGIILADSNGFKTDRAKILNSKIVNITIENQNVGEKDPDDSTKVRTFGSYFDSISVYIKFGTPFNINDNITSPTSNYKLIGTYAVQPTDTGRLYIPALTLDPLSAFLPNPLPPNATPQPMVIALVSRCKRVINSGNEFKLKATANVILKVVKK